MRTMLVLAFCSIFLISWCHGSANVRTNNTFMIDSAGRVRIYHGTNFVMKAPPWYPSELLDEKLVAAMEKSGLNFVRLGIMWAGVEPKAQQYNATYLNIMKKIVELLRSHNIFVLLDMHQDVLSSRVQSYDGIPAWLYDQFPAPAHPFPWPLKTAPPIGDWFFGYLTEACSHGFQCLYNNVAGALDSMGNFWRVVAQTFGGYSNILGYEFINEPWAGNYIDNPFLLLPGVAGSTNLQPLYDKLIKSIRSVDNDTLIFYEPVTWGVRLNGKYVGTGFTHVPGGDAYRDRSVLSYHYYCMVLSIDPVPGNATIPTFERVLCDDIEGPAVLESVQVDLNQLGGSAFLTEFGGCDDTPTCDEQLRWALDATDEFLQSWAYWAGFRSQDSTVDRLTRVYARAIAGKPVFNAYDPDKRYFDLYYYIDTSIKEPTEIFIPELHFPKASYNVTVSDSLKWRVDSTNPSIILVEPSDKLLQSKNPAVLGTVQINPKK